MNSLQFIAIYNDGTMLRQYEPSKVNSYDEINRDKLSAFVVYRNNYQKKILELHLEPGQRLIYRKRELNGEGWQYPTEVYLVGWQLKAGDQNIQSINFIFGDDTIINRGSWDGAIPEGLNSLADEEIKRLFYIRQKFAPGIIKEPVQLLEKEK